MNTIPTIFTIINVLIFILLFFWALRVREKEDAIKDGLDDIREQEAKEKPFKTYFAKYTITESDEKYPIGKLRAIAKQRMLGYIARQIGRDLEPTIVSKDGVEVEYQYTIEARRKEVAENPKLVPSNHNRYEAIWKEVK